jgi:hypothetical protein
MSIFMRAAFDNIESKSWSDRLSVIIPILMAFSLGQADFSKGRNRSIAIPRI